MLIIATLFYSYEFFLRVTPSVMTKQLMSLFSISAQQVGMLSSFYFWAYTPMQLFVGVLMDHYRVRSLMILATTACTIGACLFFSVFNYYLACLGRFAIGFGSAFAFVAVMKIAADWFPNKYFALISGLTTTLGMLGAISGEFLLSNLLHNTSYTHTVILIIFIGSIITLISTLFIRDHHALDHKASLLSELNMLINSVLSVMRNKQIWISAIVGAALYMPTTFFGGQWAIPYFMDVHHLSRHDASFLSSILFAGWAFGAPLMGWLSTISGRRKPWLLCGTIIAFVCSYVLLYNDISNQQAMLLMFIIGLVSSTEVLVFAIAHEVTQNQLTATAIALTNMVIMMGGFMQFFVGAMLDYSHQQTNTAYNVADYQFALILVPICFLVGMLFCLFLKETFCQKKSNLTPHKGHQLELHLDH